MASRSSEGLKHILAGEGSASLSGLPPVDASAKEAEKHQVQGDEVLVKCHMFRTLDDWYVESKFASLVIKAKQGTEVKKVKLQLSQEVDNFPMDPNKMQVRYMGKVLIDPLSLVDGWGPDPEHHDLDVICNAY